MDIEIYSKRDRSKIFELFEKVMELKMTLPYWNWRYQSFGEPIRTIMKENNQIIGHVVGQQIPMKLENRVENVLLLMDGMVDPNFRGKGVFSQILKFTYKKSYEFKYRLAIGFSNQEAASIHFNNLGMIEIGHLPEYRILVNKFYHNDEQFKIKKISNFDSKIDQIWKKYEKNYNFIIPRTSEYLNWRFIKIPKIRWGNLPISEYFCYIVEKDSVPEAYFVFKKFGNEHGHLVDYFGNITENIFKTMILFSLNLCKELNLKKFSLWASFSLDETISKICLPLGFSKNISDANFGVQLFDKSLEALMKQKNWYITMSDSDIF